MCVGGDVVGVEKSQHGRVQTRSSARLSHADCRRTKTPILHSASILHHQQTISSDQSCEWRVHYEVFSSDIHRHSTPHPHLRKTHDYNPRRDTCHLVDCVSAVLSTWNGSNSQGVTLRSTCCSQRQCSAETTRCPRAVRCRRSQKTR